MIPSSIIPHPNASAVLGLRPAAQQIRRPFMVGLDQQAVRYANLRACGDL